MIAVIFEVVPSAAGRAEYLARAAQLGPLLAQVAEKYGSASIGLGLAGMASATPDWTMARKFASPRYTTEWSDLPVVRAV